MGDTRPVYPLKSINQNPTIGIGITTYKRPDILSQCLAGFKAYMPPNSTLFVNDDSERGEGIAAAKNRCISALEGYDYIFLFDDDIWPSKNYWWVPFIRGAIEHNCHVFSSSWCHKTISKHETLLNISNPNGVCVFLTKYVCAAIGGYNTIFGRYGGEHEDYALRAHAHDLTPFPVCDIEDSITYFKALDMDIDTRCTITTIKSYNEQTKRCVQEFYFSIKRRLWVPYKKQDIILIIEPYVYSIDLLKQFASAQSIHIIVYCYLKECPTVVIPNVSFISKKELSLLDYFISNIQYVDKVFLINYHVYTGIVKKGNVYSSIGEHTIGYLNRVTSHNKVSHDILSPSILTITADRLVLYLSHYLYHVQSIFNHEAPSFVGINYSPIHIKSLANLDVRPVVMILGCKRYRQSMDLAIKRFTSPMWHVVAVEGGGDTTTYSDESHILTLNVEDTYDRLPIKVYKAFMWILNKWPNAVGIFKTDEDIWFKDVKELEMNIAMKHMQLFWGMRAEKVEGGPLSDLSTSKMVDKTPGKTYPASHYCWGHGYYVARGALELLKDCNGDYDTQYLEDVCTGACLNRFGITPSLIKMKYIEVDREAILRGEVKMQNGHKFDVVAWRQ